MMLAQITVPGSHEMMNAAVETHNWVIVVLVGLIIVILTAFAVVGVFGGKYVLSRLSEQDRYIQNTLVRVVQECSSQISSNTEALHEYSKSSREVISRLESRPCQWLDVRDGKIIIRNPPGTDQLAIEG